MFYLYVCMCNLMQCPEAGSECRSFRQVLATTWVLGTDPLSHLSSPYFLRKKLTYLGLTSNSLHNIVW